MVHKTIYLYPVVGFEVTNSTKSKVTEEFKVCKKFVKGLSTHALTYTHAFIFHNLSFISRITSLVTSFQSSIPSLIIKEREIFFKTEKDKKRKEFVQYADFRDLRSPGTFIYFGLQPSASLSSLPFPLLKFFFFS